MTTSADRIVITGASGKMASALRPLLVAAGHQLVLVDTREPETPPAQAETMHLMSVTDSDALARVIEGADLLVHLAGFASERPWSDILATNIAGGHAVLDACLRGRVPRVLLASSVHAVGYTPLAEANAQDVLPPRPDTLYGVGKVALEALGSLYADRQGLSVVSARIMNFAEAPTTLRGLALWFSPADFARLVEATLRLSEPGHHIVWGVSRNTRGIVSLRAGERMGFSPQDDAESHANTVCSDDVEHELLAGPFIDAAHPMGEGWSIRSSTSLTAPTAPQSHHDPLPASTLATTKEG